MIFLSLPLKIERSLQESNLQQSLRRAPTYCQAEVNLNGIENAVVLLSYPEKAFGNPKALRAFISTNVALSTQEILSCYVYRWSIEIFFRQCKDKMALDGYQLRSVQGIKRYWLLMSLAHFMCIAGTGEFCSFETGYHKICGIVQLEKYRYLFQCAKESNDFDSFIKLAGQFCAIFQIYSFIVDYIEFSVSFSY